MKNLMKNMCKYNKKHNKKAAIQLSINFIVLTILSLIVLGIGFYLVTNIFITATEYKGILDEQTKESILATLKKSGELISLPIIQYTVRRGENEIIGVGLINNAGSEQTFYITAECTEAVDNQENELCYKAGGISCDNEASGYCSKWILLDTEQITLKNREDAVISLFVSVSDDAPSGIFGYSFKVCTANKCGSSGSTQYGTTKKFYINVPE